MRPGVERVIRGLLFVVGALLVGVLVFIILAKPGRFEFQSGGKEMIKLDKKTGQTWRLRGDKWEEIGLARETVPPKTREEGRREPPSRELSRREGERLGGAAREREEYQEVARFKAEGFREVGGGFLVGRLRYERRGQGPAIIIGEVANGSGRDFRQASFDVTAYGEEGKVMGRGRFSISDLRPGETKGFDASLGEVDTTAITRTVITYKGGS